MTSIRNNLKLLLGAFLFLSASLLFSCQKDNSISNEPVSDEEAVTMSEESAAADAEYEETAEIGLSVDADLEAAARAGHNNFGAALNANVDLFFDLAFRLGPCTKITVTPNDTTYPKTVVIDYGDGCICRPCAHLFQRRRLQLSPEPGHVLFYRVPRTARRAVHFQTTSNGRRRQPV